MAINYRPKDMSMWDTWFLVNQGKAHAFYLQRLAPNSSRQPWEADWIGHAVSEDLIHWIELPLALGPGDKGSLDEIQPWTGCVISRDHQNYMYYTMRNQVGNGFGQRIGLATSQDLETWKRYSNNPVISPDPRWYISHNQPLPKNVVDCRDMIVVQKPNKSEWIGFFAARIPAEEEAETAVIAAAISDDLIHWNQLPPVFIPKKHACIEVPDVFQLNGRWYMTCLTGTGWGNRGGFSDPNILRGTIYAMAEQLEGPYHEFKDDNVFIGGDMFSGYSCRSLFFEDQRYTFYTQPTPTGKDTLSFPVSLRTTKEGYLRPSYSPRLESLRNKKLAGSGHSIQTVHLLFSTSIWPIHAGKWKQIDGNYFGESRTGWQVADLKVGAMNVEVVAKIRLKEGISVGIVFRPNSACEWPMGDKVFGLDSQENCTYAANLPDFSKIIKRTFEFNMGQSYNFRLFICLQRFELYIDNWMILQGVIEFDSIISPSIGLFVDRGKAEISELEIYDIEE